MVQAASRQRASSASFASTGAAVIRAVRAAAPSQNFFITGVFPPERASGAHGMHTDGSARLVKLTSC
jgi:hypothetical protein